MGDRRGRRDMEEEEGDAEDGVVDRAHSGVRGAKLPPRSAWYRSSPCWRLGARQNRSSSFIERSREPASWVFLPGRTLAVVRFPSEAHEMYLESTRTHACEDAAQFGSSVVSSDFELLTYIGLYQNFGPSKFMGPVRPHRSHSHGPGPGSTSVCTLEASSIPNQNCNGTTSKRKKL